MILNCNLFQNMLDAKIQNDTLSSMNPRIREKYDAILTIEKYIQSIPFVQSSVPYYGTSAFGERQKVKEHFCSFWKMELGLSSAEETKLDEIFERSITAPPQFADNNSYLIFTDENNVISVQSMECAIFDALDLT